MKHKWYSVLLWFGYLCLLPKGLCARSLVWGGRTFRAVAQWKVIKLLVLVPGKWFRQLNHQAVPVVSFLESELLKRALDFYPHFSFLSDCVILLALVTTMKPSIPRPLPQSGPIRSPNLGLLASKSLHKKVFFLYTFLRLRYFVVAMENGWIQTLFNVMTNTLHLFLALQMLHILPIAFSQWMTPLTRENSGTPNFLPTRCLISSAGIVFPSFPLLTAGGRSLLSLWPLCMPWTLTFYPLKLSPMLSFSTRLVLPVCKSLLIAAWNSKILLNLCFSEPTFLKICLYLLSLFLHLPFTVLTKWLYTCDTGLA